MERKIHWRHVALCGILFSALAVIISIPVCGWKPDLAEGILAGTAVMLINFKLLQILLGYFLREKPSYGPAFLLYIVRLALYALAAYGSFRLGLAALIGFAIGVSGVVPGAVFADRMSGRADKKSR